MKLYLLLYFIRHLYFGDIAGALPGSLGHSAFHPSVVGKSSTGLLAGVKAGRVHLCRVAGNTE